MRDTQAVNTATAETKFADEEQVHGMVGKPLPAPVAPPPDSTAVAPGELTRPAVIPVNVAVAPSAAPKKRKKKKNTRSSIQRRIAAKQKEKEKKVKRQADEVERKKTLNAMQAQARKMEKDSERAGKKVAGLYARIDLMTRRSTGHAIEAGKVLIFEKGNLKETTRIRKAAGMSRKNWGEWLADHKIHPRRAQRDMKLAAYFARIIVDPLPPLTEAYLASGAISGPADDDSDLDKEEQQEKLKAAENFKNYELEWQGLRTDRADDLGPKLADAASSILHTLDPNSENSKLPLLTKFAVSRETCRDIAKTLGPMAETLRDDMVLGVVIIQLPATGKIAPTLSPSAGRTTL